MAPLVRDVIHYIYVNPCPIILIPPLVRLSRQWRFACLRQCLRFVRQWSRNGLIWSPNLNTPLKPLQTIFPLMSVPFAAVMSKAGAKPLGGKTTHPASNSRSLHANEYLQISTAKLRVENVITRHVQRRIRCVMRKAVALRS